MSARTRSLAISAQAVVVGLAVAIIGSVPKNVLFAANLRYLPAIPWAVPLTAVYLWAYWRYLGGIGESGQSAERRRANLRANRIAMNVWIWALVAGALGIVALVLWLRVANRLIVLPPQQFFDVTGVSFVTVASLVVMGAIAAGIVEEASFRGYMQGPIERRLGPVTAIVVTGVFFGLLHVADVTPALLPYYIAVAAIYGGMTYYTNSILPSVVLHTAGNIWSSSYLWAYGHAEWQATPNQEPLIWETGMDASFRGYLIAAVVMLAVTIAGYAKLARVTRGERTASTSL